MDSGKKESLIDKILSFEKDAKLRLTSFCSTAEGGKFLRAMLLILFTGFMLRFSLAPVVDALESIDGSISEGSHDYGFALEGIESNLDKIESAIILK